MDGYSTTGLIPAVLADAPPTWQMPHLPGRCPTYLADDPPTWQMIHLPGRCPTYLEDSVEGEEDGHEEERALEVLHRLLAGGPSPVVQHRDDEGHDEDLKGGGGGRERKEERGFG